MVNWFKEIFHDIHGLLLPAVFAIVVLLVVTDTQSIRIALAKVLAGLFCAIVFTDPFLHWLGRDPMIYKTATAGVFAMVGHEFIRTLSSLNLQKIIDTIKSIRGK